MARFVFAGFAIALILSNTLTVTAAPPLKSPNFPEQKNYCQPALGLVNQYYDGAISYDTVLKNASLEIEKCRTTNKLGAHLSMAQLASITRQPNLAATEARAALALAPDESEAHRRLCLVLPNGAEKTAACEGMKRFSAQSVLINFSLGQTAIQNRNYAEAIRLLSDVITRRPDYGGAWVERGRAKSLSGDKNGGLFDVEKALQLLPLKSSDASLAVNQKIAILDSLNRQADMVALLDSRIALSPNDHNLRMLRGKAHLKTRQYKLAAIDCSFVEKNTQDYKIKQSAKDCASSARFSEAGNAQRKKDCSRFLNFGGKSYEVSAGHFDDGRVYVSFPQMKLAERSAGNSKIDVNIYVDENTEAYSDRFTFYLTLQTEPYQSAEERQMRARALEIGWYGELSKKFSHIMHGELVAQNGAKVTFSNKDAYVLFSDLPTGKAPVSSATPEMQHFGPAAFADKRFRLRVWYTSTGAKVTDEDIFLPTDLNQRLTQMKAAAAQLKASATPGWC